MNKRQIIISVLTIIIFGGSIGLMYFLSTLKKEPEAKPRVEIKKYVKTQAVNYSDVQTEVRAFGRVQTAQYLDLLSEVSGRMYEGNVRLKEGSRFRKGDLLFRIDDREASLNLKSQKSNFLRDLAAILPDMKLDFESNYKPWQDYFNGIDIEKDIPSLPKSTSEKEKTFLATKGIYSNYYTIKSAEVRLGKYKYYAPWDGSISEVGFETGAFINPGARIGKIIRSGTHELKVNIETRDIPWIQVGSSVKIYSEEMNNTWDGEIARISDFVNQSTQSVSVVISINQNVRKIYDGQFLLASIPAQIIKDGMIIPRNIIYNGNEVFVVEDTVLKMKTIDIYRVTENDAIFGGLKEGEDLVVEPLLNAHNNMTVFKDDQRDINLETKNANNTSISAKEENKDQVD